MKIFKKCTVLIYLLLLLYLTLFSQYFGRIYFHKNVNLIPFHTKNQYIKAYGSIFNITVINLAGNVAAFVPFGFLMPLILNGNKKSLKVLGMVAVSSLFIETMQYLLGVGVSDIDDLILNITGGVLGIVLYKMIICLYKYQSKIHKQA